MTVRQVQDFLNGRLAKYASWELSDDYIKQLFESEAHWRNTKSKGAGRNTILKFIDKPQGNSSSTTTPLLKRS